MVEKNKKKRILLISSWFPEDVGRRTLMSELADAVVAAGDEIDVIAIDWRDVDQTDKPTAIHQNPGMTVYRFKPLLISKPGKSIHLMAKWIGTSLKATGTTFKLLYRHKYDVIVAHAPSPVWAPVLICNLLSKSKKYLIQWDFVPYHQRATGLMSDGMSFKVLLLLEKILVRGFDVIGCMSKMNIDFLKAHYWIGQKQKIEILPIWTDAVFPPASDRIATRKKYSLPLKMKIAVFGGTLSKGRGIDDIVSAARIAHAKKENLLYLVIGRGPLELDIREQAKGIKQLRIMEAIPRHDYLSLLGACDCGIVATQSDTGVPTFPSKTMDYFRAGIPVIASIENSTDYGSFLELHGAGVLVQAGNYVDLHQAVMNLCSNSNKIRQLVENGRALILNYFNVKRTVDQLI